MSRAGDCGANGTGNISMRRSVFDPAHGLGLRFDPQLNLLGFEDFEFFGDLIRAGGTIFQSTRAISISRPTPDALPNSAERPLEARRVFAMMEGRNEIVSTRLRHGMGASLLRLVRRQTPQLVRGLVSACVWPLLALVRSSKAQRRREDAAIRLAKVRSGVAGLWRPGYERPLARQGKLREVA